MDDKEKLNIEGTEWGDLFYEEHIDADDTIDVSESDIVFETQEGVKYTEYRNYKKFDIKEFGKAKTKDEIVAKIIANRNKNQ